MLSVHTTKHQYGNICHKPSKAYIKPVSIKQRQLKFNIGPLNVYLKLLKPNQGLLSLKQEPSSAKQEPLNVKQRPLNTKPGLP